MAQKEERGRESENVGSLLIVFDESERSRNVQKHELISLFLTFRFGFESRFLPYVGELKLVWPGKVGKGG